jgi:hypothetical protein
VKSDESPTGIGTDSMVVVWITLADRVASKNAYRNLGKKFASHAIPPYPPLEYEACA